MPENKVQIIGFARIEPNVPIAHTTMTLRCEFTDKGGNSLLVRDITGKVRFFGSNLKATYDFAKKAAKVADEKFSSVADRS